MIQYVTQEYFLVISTLVFLIACLGMVLNRTSILQFLMALELLFLSCHLNLVYFTAVNGAVMGHVFSIYLLTVAGAEAAIGLALLISYKRLTGKISLDSEPITRD